MDSFADIERAVYDLKVERDTWQALALQYKAAFEAQTCRLWELKDICFAAQAELENERVQQRRLNAMASEGRDHSLGTVDGAEDAHSEQLFGTALILSPRENDLDRVRRSSEDCTKPLFTRVQYSIAQRNYGTALLQIERLLRGPLSSEARAEGLLLKSEILRASGPDELYDALAACSEALDLCDRLSELEAFLPRLQYQRNILYYELRTLHQAQEVFRMASYESLHPAKVDGRRTPCDGDNDQLQITKRRSGFDEKRTVAEGLLAQLEEKEYDVSALPNNSLTISRDPTTDRASVGVRVLSYGNMQPPRRKGYPYLVAGSVRRPMDTEPRDIATMNFG